MKSLRLSRHQLQSFFRSAYQLLYAVLTGLIVFGLLCLLSGLYFIGYWQLEKALCEVGGFFSNGCYEAWAEPLFMAAGGIWSVGLLCLMVYIFRYSRRSKAD
ncbi:MAG: hypothetical protein CL693_16815 [Cellvibrionaceae bacterium]|nr:hypothetical protein [Cellvibrionaceae bacterium]